MRFHLFPQHVHVLSLLKVANTVSTCMLLIGWRQMDALINSWLPRKVRSVESRKKQLQILLMLCLLIEFQQTRHIAIRSASRNGHSESGGSSEESVPAVVMTTTTTRGRPPRLKMENVGPLNQHDQEIDDIFDKNLATVRNPVPDRIDDWPTPAQNVSNSIGKINNTWNCYGGTLTFILLIGSEIVRQGGRPKKVEPIRHSEKKKKLVKHTAQEHKSGEKATDNLEKVKITKKTPGKQSKRQELEQQANEVSKLQAIISPPYIWQVFRNGTLPHTMNLNLLLQQNPHHGSIMMGNWQIH